MYAPRCSSAVSPYDVSEFDIQVYTYVYIHTYMHMYTYGYLYRHVCMQRAFVEGLEMEGSGAVFTRRTRLQEASSAESCEKCKKVLPYMPVRMSIYITVARQASLSLVCTAVFICFCGRAFGSPQSQAGYLLA